MLEKESIENKKEELLEIEANLGEEVEQIIEEEKSKRDKRKSKKSGEKRKKIKVSKIVLGIIGLVIIFIVATSVINSMKPMSVNVSTVATGDISQTVDTSGEVTSLVKKVYFSDLDVKLGELAVKKGDSVNKGELLYKYDEKDLSDKALQADLKAKETKGSYDDKIMLNAVNGDRLSVANLSLEILEQQISDWEAYIDAMEYNIENKKASLAKEGALLRTSLNDWSPSSEEYSNLQKLIENNTYEQSYNKDIRNWQNELDKAKENLSEFKALKNEMRSQKLTEEVTVLTEGGKNELEAKTEASLIDAENTAKACENASDGIRAEFNGIVMSADAIEGSTLSKGTQILSLASTDELVVDVNLTKYDTSLVKLGQTVDITLASGKYEGKVYKINRMAEKNDSGASVVGCLIRIDNPDDSITLGLDAKVSIHVGDQKDAVIIPNEAIIYGADGIYVMLVSDGIVKKAYIKSGISNDLNTQVLEGINPGDMLIMDNLDILEEGTKVNPIIMQ